MHTAATMRGHEGGGLFPAPPFTPIFLSRSAKLSSWRTLFFHQPLNSSKLISLLSSSSISRKAICKSPSLISSEPLELSRSSTNRANSSSSSTPLPSLSTVRNLDRISASSSSRLSAVPPMLSILWSIYSGRTRLTPWLAPTCMTHSSGCVWSSRIAQPQCPCSCSNACRTVLSAGGFSIASA
jgi:hypothetical protein